MCVAAVNAQPADSGQLSPELLLLSRVRHHELQQLQRQPNFTCIETVERTQRTAATKRFQMVDTLRLEVALVGGKELFAWPGSKKFEDTEITDMVQRGAIGNGAFGLLARMVFEGRSATFDYRGEETLEGRPEKLVRWDYKVPRMLSGYSIRVGQRRAIVGFHGSFWVDPKSLDLRRLEKTADDIPPELELASASDRVDYARVPIGEQTFLLPSGSELRMVDLGGTESRNQIRFTACRQYSGESVVSFADPSEESLATKEPRAVKEVEVPGGLTLTLSLETALELKSSAVGDPVEARLHGDVKHKGRILLPKGAVVSGRISTLQVKTEFTLLGLTFTDVAAEGLHSAVKLTLDSVLGVGRVRARTTQSRLEAPRPGEGLILVPSTQPRLMRGTLMYWRN
jgi:hypothetical protein